MTFITLPGCKMSPVECKMACNTKPAGSFNIVDHWRKKSHEKLQGKRSVWIARR